MPKFKAKNDTYYRFSYIKKGEEINGGAELYNSGNFEPVDGQKPDLASEENNHAEEKPDLASEENNHAEEKPAKLSYKELCLLGKELGIENYNKMPYPALAAKVAEVQAKTAQPTSGDGQSGNSEENKGNDGGDSAGNADDNKADAGVENTVEADKQ